MRSTVAVLLLAILSACAFAQGGPPLITDDPGTPGNHHWEINVAGTITYLRLGKDYELPHLDLNYGYGDNVQFKLEGPLTIFNSSGNNFTSLAYTDWGVKWRFQEEKGGLPAISTYPQILFVGNQELARIGLLDPGTDFYLPLEASKTFGHFILDGEFGLLFRQFTGTQVSTGVCSEYDLLKNFALLGEVHFITSSQFVRDQSVWNLGFKYDFTEHQSLLFSAGRSFLREGDDEPGFLMYLGVQFRT